MSHQEFKQLIEQTETFDINIYKQMVQQYGEEEINMLFKEYMSNPDIENFDNLEQINENKFESNLYQQSTDEEYFYQNDDSLHAIDLYLKEIEQFPVLKPKQQKQLAIKMDELRNKKERLKITNDNLDKELTTIGYQGPFNKECYSRRKQSRYIDEKLSQLKLQKEQLKEKQITDLSSSDENEISALIQELDQEIIHLGNLQEKLNIQHDYQEIYELLVNSNLKLVVSIAKIYSESEVPLLDLIQEGNKGLMRAIEKFDATKDTKLSTYAMWWIYKFINVGIYNQSALIKIPENKQEKIKKILDTENMLTNALERKPTYEEIAVELNDDKINANKIRDILKYSTIKDCISLSTPIDDESTILDTIIDETTNVEESALLELLKTELEEVYKIITPREKKILSLRYGLDDGITRTLDEVGLKFNVSGCRIGQIERKTLRKINNDRAINKRIKDFL